MTLPRVTEILTDVGLAPDFGAVAPAVLDAARARGTAVHAALEAHHYGYLVDADLEPAARPYLVGYRRFLDESGHEPLRSEFAVIHPVWHYIGHPDRVGWINGRRWLLDWKTAESVDLAYAALQLAGYRLAWNAAHPMALVEAVAVVQFRADGTYRSHRVPIGVPDQLFLAAVLVYRARLERRRA